MAHSSVDYIFVKDELRGRGLSTLLLERALDTVCLWLEMQLRDGDVLEYNAYATFKSRQGRRVVTRWDATLMIFCKRRGIEYWAASLHELGLLPDR